jgi:hypothetical protein
MRATKCIVDMHRDFLFMQHSRELGNGTPFMPGLCCAIYKCWIGVAVLLFLLLFLGLSTCMGCRECWCCSCCSVIAAIVLMARTGVWIIASRSAGSLALWLLNSFNSRKGTYPLPGFQQEQTRNQTQARNTKRKHGRDDRKRISNKCKEKSNSVSTRSELQSPKAAPSTI